MKNTRAMVMIAISIVAAVAAVWIAARWVSQETALRTGKLVVANADIDIGSKLTAPMVRLADWPVGSVPAGAITEEARAVDRVVLARLQKGEPVLESRLAPEGAKAGLSAIVSKGKRAITVKVNEVVGVAGFALPGNYVDVMVNTQEEGTKRSDKDTSLSKIVLERILVLAVAQETTTDASKPKIVSAVTLELTPEEAERLDLARSVGTLSLVLRNQVDQASVQTPGATKSKLLGVAAAPPPPAAVVAAPASVVYRKPAAVASPKPPQPVESIPRKCVTVLNGMEASSECF
jgi:pilus assembly protein CpaB